MATTTQTDANTDAAALTRFMTAAAGTPVVNSQGFSIGTLAQVKADASGGTAQVAAEAAQAAAETARTEAQVASVAAAASQSSAATSETNAANSATTAAASAAAAAASAGSVQSFNGPTIETQQNQIIALTGMPAGSETFLTTFSGATIRDNATMVQALTDLELALEAVSASQIAEVSNDAALSSGTLTIIAGAHTVTFPANPADETRVFAAPGNGDWTTLGAIFNTTDGATIAAGQPVSTAVSAILTFIYDAAASNWRMFS